MSAARCAGREMQVQDAEPRRGAPAPVVARAYGYGVYSARYGNIYTVRQLVAAHWRCRDGTGRSDRYLGMRGGFTMRCADDRPGRRLCHAGRGDGAAAFASAGGAEAFGNLMPGVFTLGLTECWSDRDTGRVFPTCPGIVAGSFDAGRPYPADLRHAEVLADLGGSADAAALNPGCGWS